MPETTLLNEWETRRACVKRRALPNKKRITLRSLSVLIKRADYLVHGETLTLSVCRFCQHCSKCNSSARCSLESALCHFYNTACSLVRVQRFMVSVLQHGRATLRWLSDDRWLRDDRCQNGIFHHPSRRCAATAATFVSLILSANRVVKHCTSPSGGPLSIISLIFEDSPMETSCFSEGTRLKMT